MIVSAEDRLGFRVNVPAATASSSACCCAFKPRRRAKPTARRPAREDRDRLRFLATTFQTLVEDNVQWQTLIAGDVVWELPYAPAIGDPAQLIGAGGGSASRYLVCRGSGRPPLLRSQGVCLH